jgi:class 3 adenylate cyclase/tetratricopeptide (TPR) repeat protein
MTATGDQIANLKQAIAALESQRATLGNAVVDSGLASMRKQLAELQRQPELPSQQRKLATILFTDVVGSTRLGRHLEPDEVLEMIDAALKRLAGAVDQQGGHVTRFQGDGFKAVFGVPVAHENDPEQAVLAGLEILQLAQNIAQEWQDQRGIPNFQVRVGINTGLIASGGETEAQDTIMGRAVNLAARLESAAPAGGLLISHFTYRHVRGVFEVDILPPIKAKGFEEPVAVYLVKRARPRTFRVLSRGVEGIETPMVGRQNELKYLQDALLTAIEEGEGQVVTVSGEAGVGKSRLLYEFQNWIELLPGRVRLYQGQARLETQHIPYVLMRDVFSFRFKIQESDSPLVVREKIEQGIGQAFSDQPSGYSSQRLVIADLLPSGSKLASKSKENRKEVEENAHFLGQMLGFDFSASLHLTAHLQDAQALRNRGMNSLREYFLATSRQLPVVVFLEDVHWADDSSLDAVKELGKLTATHPILLVCLARPSLYERRPYWGEGQEYHRKMELQPLSKRESRQLVEEILQHVDHVPFKLRELVVQGAEGNPFYIEELIKMLVERGVIVRSEISPQGVELWRVMEEQLEQEQVPSTLMGVLQARLDSLTRTERQVLQQAAVIGRTFWDLVVVYIHTYGNGKVKAEEIDGILKRLREKELVFRREDSAIEGAQEYIFKHDVLREVTYDTVLVKDRKVYHGLVADWLLANSGERMGEHYGLVAEHLELAGKVEEAAGYFTQAGDRALENYANAEAQGYYQRALNLNPMGGLRVRLLTGIGRAFDRQGSYELAMQHWGEGMQLCQQQDDVQGLVRLYILAVRASCPLYVEQAMQLCQHALKLEPRLEESSLLAHLLHQVGRTHLFNRLPEGAAEYCQHALAMGERLGDAEVQADTLCTMGLFPQLSAEKAVETLTEAEQLAESHHLYRILARATLNLAGLMLMRFEDLQTSIVYLLKSAEAHRMRGSYEGELDALNAAAVRKVYLGEFQGAQALFEYVDERLRFIPKIDNVDLSMLGYRGLYQAMKGNWADASDAAWQNYKHAEKSNSPALIADTVLGLLQVLLEVDRFYLKQDWQDVETIIKQVIGRSVDRVDSVFYSWMSNLSSRQCRYKAAEHWLGEAKREMLDAPYLGARWAFSLAEIELAIAKKEWGKAITTIENTLKFLSKTGLRWGYARILLDWGAVLVARLAAGDLDKAREIYQQSLEMFTEMGAAGYVQVVEQRLIALEEKKILPNTLA